VAVNRKSDSSGGRSARNGIRSPPWHRKRYVGMCRADVKVIATVQLTSRNPQNSTFEHDDVIVRPVMVIVVA